MVALAAKPHLFIAALLVGAFAIFHGYAHGAELPDGADAVAYSLGFVIATGLLHLAGIAVGLLAQWPAGRYAVRAAGGIDSLGRRRLPWPPDMTRKAAALTAALLLLPAGACTLTPS